MSKAKRTSSRRIILSNIETNRSSTTTSSRNTMNSHYAVGTGGGAVKRIRTPLKHDVLCGRGGGINSHPGNQTFREIVKERKNAYNLAANKAEKARVAREVVDMVQNLSPPGRFLEKENDGAASSSVWWVECSLAKALSKTSQALREGAPSIRAAYSKDVPATAPVRTTSRKSVANSVAQTLSTAMTGTSESPNFMPAVTGKKVHRIVADSNAAEEVESSDMHCSDEAATPSTPNGAGAIVIAPLHDEGEEEGRPNKRPRMEHATVERHVPYLAPLLSNQEFDHLYGRSERTEQTAEFDATAPTPPPEVTPPLAPIRATEMPVPLSSFPPAMENFLTPLPRRPMEQGLRRANSLALSDVSSDFATEEFVNPFEDESRLEQFWQTGNFRQTSTSSTSSSWGRASLGNLSNETLELQDSSSFSKYQESDFSNGMKLVYDAAHPGLLISSLDGDGDDETIPTHLYPFRSSSFSRRLAPAPSVPLHSPTPPSSSDSQ